MIKIFKKLILTFLLFTFYFITGVHSADAAFRMPPNNLGLVGYWAMNDATGTKATDYSGNGNTGTLTNGPTWGAGKRSGAVVLDGNNDEVTVADNDTLDFGSGDFSISFWLKTNSSVRRTIIDKFDTGAGNVGYYVDIMADGTIRTAYQSGVSDYRVRDSAATVNSDTWQHVLITKTGATNSPDIYVNGVLSNGGVFSSGTTASSSNTKAFSIAKAKGADLASNLIGSLDEVRVYNRALSSTEVTNLYNSGVAKFKTATANGLVGHWKLDDASGTKATDSSGSGNTGTLTNFALSGAVSNWINGKRGGALDFDGTNDYIDAGTSATLKPADFTFSTWVKYDVLTNYMSIASTSADPAGYANGWVLEGRDSPYVLRLFVAGTAATNPTQIQTGVWYHVVSKYVTSTNTKTLYVNGVAGTPVSSGSTLSYVSDNPFSIGAQRTGPTSAYPNQTWYPFNGQIDESRLYNRALTDAEITTLYNSGAAKLNSSTAGRGGNLTSGLVGHWTFDGSKLTTTTATDSSGSANHATPTNSPTPAQGKLGQALSFNGTNNYVNAYSMTSLHGQSAVTYSAWIYRTGGTLYDGIVSKFDSSNSIDMILGGTLGGVDDIFMRVSPVSATNYGFSSSNVITPNTWHHVVMVFDGTQTGNENRLKLYVNNVQQSLTFSGTIPVSTPTVGANLSIGAYQTYYFPGSIDDVRVYNRALTAAEVLQLYNLR